MLALRAVAVEVSPNAVFDLLAQVGVDVVPVLERPRQHRFLDTFGHVADDVVRQTLSRGIVENLAHQGACLSRIVVVLTQGVGGADHLTVGRPVHIGRAHRVGPAGRAGDERLPPAAFGGRDYVTDQLTSRATNSSRSKRLSPARSATRSSVVIIASSSRCSSRNHHMNCSPR
jgi:hypothetical protein